MTPLDPIKACEIVTGYGKFLFGRLQLDHGEIEGRRVNSFRVDALVDEVKAHLDWTDEQVGAAFARAGAKYGPDKKRDLVDALRLQRFGPVIGKVRKWEASFRLRLVVPDRGADDISSLHWVVAVEGQSSTGELQCFSLSFEPFAGEHVGIGRRACLEDASIEGTNPPIRFREHSTSMVTR